MPVISLDGFETPGLVTERAGSALPSGAFGTAENVLFTDGGVRSRMGDVEYFSDAALTPRALFFAQSTLERFIIMCEDAAIKAIGASTIVRDISRTSGVYTAANTRWTGGNFNGLLVLNNKNDMPQFWVPGSTTVAADLSNWNVLWRTGALRPFKNFLIALDVYKAGIRNPTLVKWSHPADPGALPSSWDETDPTKDAGEFPLSDTAGFCIDGLAQRDTFIVYKEDVAYSMAYVGGQSVFAFRRVFDSQGIIAPKCAVAIPDGRHAVLGRDDIYVHNGQTARSIVTGKIRGRIFNELSTAVENCFAIHNVKNTEVWFCVPTGAATYPDMAFCWNYSNDTWSMRDLHSTTDIEAGQAPEFVLGTEWDYPTGGPTWEDTPDTYASSTDVWDITAGYSWDADTEIWDQRLFSQSEAQLYGAYPLQNEVRYVQTGWIFSDGNVEAVVEKRGIGVPLIASQPPDFYSVKFFRGMRLHIGGDTSQTVQVSVGVHDYPEQEPEWFGPVNYNIGSDDLIDIRASGRLLAIRITSSSVSWQLYGVDVDLTFGGGF